jgi:hypothetical protein
MLPSVEATMLDCGRFVALGLFFSPVCTENLNPHIVVMKSAKDCV